MEKMNRLKNGYVERVSAAGAYVPWGAKFQNSQRQISGITLNNILNSRSHFCGLRRNTAEPSRRLVVPEC
jgi:hypothetical protein